MLNEQDYVSLLSQLNNSEKGDIITDGELEEIGVAYESKEKYEETMRNLAERLSMPSMGRGSIYLPVGKGKTSPRIKAGATMVLPGNIQKIKRINITGKVIASSDDAAKLFSAFRDPRIEIFNIVYASEIGEILAHTAWTCGLPSAVRSIDGDTLQDNFVKILKIRKHLGAEKIWIAHNHPSGSPEPSDEDINCTKVYAHYLRDRFSGHIILDHSEYSLITRDGVSRTFQLAESSQKANTTRRERASVISHPVVIARMFKKILSNDENTTAHAVIDNNHRVISWVYGSVNNINEIKKYMRNAGGINIITLTNDEKLFKDYSLLSEKKSNTDLDIFLDIILINRKTGHMEKSDAINRMGRSSGAWQRNESKELRYIVNNTVQGGFEPFNGQINKELFVSETETAYSKEKNMTEKISQINQLINEKGVVQEDGTIRISKEDWNGITGSLTKKMPFLFDSNMFRMLIENEASDDEITARPKQDSQPSLSGGTLQVKENSMSDEFEERESPLSQKEIAFLNTLHQRKVITEAMKNGSLCCLPGADGYADTQGAVNMVSGKFYHGVNVLYLKEHQRENKFPTAEYITAAQFDIARGDKPDLYIRKGEKGVSIHFSEKNEDTGEWEDKSVRLFNAAQANKPWELKAWVEQNQQKEQKTHAEFMRTHFGESWQPAVPVQKETVPEIVCTSTEPATYLGQYLAAVSLGTKFKASAEQAVQFVQKMEDALYEKAGINQKTGEPFSNPFKLSKICNEASYHCKETIKEARMEIRKLQQPEQKMEQQQTRGRGIK